LFHSQANFDPKLPLFDKRRFRSYVFIQLLSSFALTNYIM